MSIQSIFVKNFKSLDDVKFTFSKTGLTVLVGANGSGKSNLVKSFDFLRVVYDKSVKDKSGLSQIDFNLLLANLSKFQKDSSVQFEIMDYQNNIHSMEFIVDTNIEEIKIKNEHFDPNFDLIQKIGVYQFIPHIREGYIGGKFKPPTLESKMSLKSNGSGLIQSCNWLIKNHPDLWDLVMEVLFTIFPKLDRVEVKEIKQNEVYYDLLFMEESNMQWNISEVSDGTFTALCMAIALVNPMTNLVVIDEPENYLHRWILRQIMDLTRKVIKKYNKQIVFTTHSHVLIDMLYPEEVSIIYKPKNETKVKSLLSLMPDIQNNWEEGEDLLSTYLDSTLLPAVPSISEEFQ